MSESGKVGFHFPYFPGGPVKPCLRGTAGGLKKKVSICSSFSFFVADVVAVVFFFIQKDIVFIKKTHTQSQFHNIGTVYSDNPFNCTNA